MDAYRFETSGRNWTTLITVLAIWVALVVLIIRIDMSIVLAVAVVLCTLPAFYDLITARAAGLSLDATTLSWHAGTKTGEVSIKKIKHIRFDTRLDLSVRLTAVLHIGQKVKIPFEATPPHRAFETELESRGIKTERHHFGFV